MPPACARVRQPARSPASKSGIITISSITSITIVVSITTI